MNKKPVSYLQYDSRWGANRYNTRTGSISIKGGGCGPTSCAMLISTLTRKQVLPTETMEWACANGYVWCGYGVVTGDYFKVQFAKYGLSCERLIYWTRASIEADIRAGYYFIAGMGPGLWTSGGHFVVLWDIDGKMRINDPASVRDERVNGDPSLFWAQVRTLYRVDARNYNYPEEEIDMTIDQMIEQITPDQVAKLAGKLTDKQLGDLAERLTEEQAAVVVAKATRFVNKKGPSPYAREACEKAIKKGLFKDGDGDGLIDNPQAPLTREQYAVLADREGHLDIPGPQDNEEE